MTAREHYKKAFKDAWKVMLLTTVLVVVVFGLSENSFPAGVLPGMGLLLGGSCLFYGFVRRNNSLEAAVIEGCLMPSALLVVTMTGHLQSGWAYYISGISAFLLFYLTWRGYLKKRLKAKRVTDG